MYYLLDTDLNLISTIENYESVIWTNSYNESGDFELYLSASKENLSLYQRGFYITRDDDWTQCMIIQNIQIITDIEAGNHLILTGKDLKSILSRRIIYPQTTVQGTVEACIRKLITLNAISPEVENRKIDRLILGVESGVETPTISTQYTGDNLETVIQNLCKTYNLGYDILLDLDEKQFVFILYRGADRSYNQTENPYVIFSDEFDNLLNSDYISNMENYKNTAIVAGEGEGLDRKNTTVGDNAGLARYETFVDAKDIKSVDEAGETIKDADYLQLLTEKGNESLAATIITEEISGEIVPNYTYKFNEDYFLGDIVEVVNEYGKSFTPQIASVTESIDNSGETTIVNFATTQ